jgi:PilZ domain
MRSADSPTSRGRDERRALRADVKANIVVRETHGTKFTAELVDISVTGFRFRTLYSVRLNAHIWITLPGLSALEAAIAWHDDPQYGATFINPLHPAVRDHLAKLYRS